MSDDGGVGSSSLQRRAASLFNLLDPDSTGHVGLQELRQCCGDLSDKDRAIIFAHLDADGDGRIDFADFQEGLRAITLTLAARRRSSSCCSESRRISLAPRSFSQEQLLDSLKEENQQLATDSENSATADDKTAEDPQLDGLHQLACKDEVCELYGVLLQDYPQLLDSFHCVLSNVIKEVGDQRRERQLLEATLQKSRQETEEYAKQLEDEMEAQLLAMQERVSDNERRKIEAEYQALVSTKMAEIDDLQRMISQLQQRRQSASHLRRAHSEHLDVKMQQKVTDTQAKNEQLLSEMRQLQAALAVSKSELVQLQQHQQGKDSELQLQRLNLQQHMKDQDALTHQLQLLHGANRQLQDTNDALREALLQKQVETGTSICSSPSHHLQRQATLPACDSCEEDEDGELNLDSGFSIPILRSSTCPQLHEPATASSSLKYAVSAAFQTQEEVASNSGSSSGSSCLLRSAHHQAPERMFKIVTAGDAGVGKTSFITRLCDATFHARTVATLGVDFRTRTVEIDGHVVVIQMWDTAGQERFRSIARSYFRRADGAVLLYDCCSERSFLSIREWLECIREAADRTIPVMLVANKIDARDEQRTAGVRVVETEAGRRLAQDCESLFIEASALSGDNVLEAVAELARLLRVREDLAVNNLMLTLADATDKQKGKQCCLR